PFGLAAIDSHLPDGGLAGGALHEIVPEDGGTPAAFGFIVALLARISANSPPQPNSGVPEFGQCKSDRSRKHPTSVGEGLGVGVGRLRASVDERSVASVNALTPPPDPPPYPPPQSLHSGARKRGPGGGREQTVRRSRAHPLIFVMPGYGLGH